MQKDENGNWRPVRYVARKLHNAELKYSVSEKESLAIVYAIHCLKFYLTQMPFDILTNHLPIVFMKNQDFQNNRIMRWILFLQSLNYTITYIKGKSNELADFLSRDLMLMQEEACHNANFISVVVCLCRSQKVISLGEILWCILLVFKNCKF